MSDDEILKDAREAFALAADAEAENRRDALDDLRFARLGEQWPERIRRDRELDPYFVRAAVATADPDTRSRWRLPTGDFTMSLRLIGLLCGLAAMLLAASGLYWKGRQSGLAEERPKTAAALARAAVATLEARGERDSAARVEVVIRQREAADSALGRLSLEALKSEDADAPLDPDRAARLRTADDELCRAARGLAGCTPPADAG